MQATPVREHLAQYHREASGWALSLCRYNADEADNVLQTAYLNILARNSMHSGRASFRTWLFAVIRKTASESRRRAWWRSWLGDAAQVATPAADLDPVAPAERELVQLQQSAQLRAALLGLPRRQHEVLQLVFYHDLSIAEAAEVMQVSTGTARQHYERGKRALRERLAGLEDT